MDGIVGDIRQSLQHAGLADTVNLIITSDHGFVDTDTKHRIIDINDYVKPEHIWMVPDDGATALIIPTFGHAGDIYQALKDVKHMTAYLKDEIPARYHYTNNRRISSIVLVADEGWMITKNRSLLWDERGNHGYSNDLESMKPIFLAEGPNFHKNMTYESIMSVDIYPLVCELLGIEPHASNGSLAHALPLIKPSS